MCSSDLMPRGVPPNRQLKLGRGGLADVEWTAQLLQLQHAGRVPELRTARTVDALDAARDAGVLSRADTERLVTAWRLAARIRAAIALASGRVTGARVDVLPHDPVQLTAVSRLLGYGPGEAADLEEDYLRAARRARRRRAGVLRLSLVPALGSPTVCAGRSAQRTRPSRPGHRVPARRRSCAPPSPA